MGGKGIIRCLRGTHFADEGNSSTSFYNTGEHIDYAGRRGNRGKKSGRRKKKTNLAKSRSEESLKRRIQGWSTYRGEK